MTRVSTSAEGLAGTPEVIRLLRAAVNEESADATIVLMRKIGPAIAKEGRALSSRSRCISLGGKMTKRIDDRSRYERNGAESGRIWKARNFIDEHAGEELSLTTVAKVADTSANYLSEKFKEAVGINFVKYVARARYEKAARLLREADLRVSEIAFASGFQSLSQFNRVFKKFSGKTPTEYRAAARARARNRREWFSPL